MEQKTAKGHSLLPCTSITYYCPIINQCDKTATHLSNGDVIEYSVIRDKSGKFHSLAHSCDFPQGDRN